MYSVLTETWVKKGDLSPYSERVSADYCFYDAPRPIGRGGGLAIITRKTFKLHCRLLSSASYTSFESQLLLFYWSEPIVLALIYRPPHLKNGFIAEFSEFIGDLVTKHDRFLLVSDFNVHVCCPSKQLSTEFLNIIDSFNLLQWVSRPTHLLGHTLDLILTFGLSITDVEVIESLISNHFPIVFMMCLPEIPQVTASDTRQTRVYSPHFCKDFTELCNKVNSSLSVESSLADLDAEHHFNSLNTVWADILNYIAPFKCFKLKPKSEPWIDNNIRSLR